MDVTMNVVLGATRSDDALVRSRPAYKWLSDPLSWTLSIEISENVVCRGRERRRGPSNHG